MGMRDVNMSYSNKLREASYTVQELIAKYREGREISIDEKADFYWAKYWTMSIRFDGQRYLRNLKAGDKPEELVKDRRIFRKSQIARNVMWEMDGVEVSEDPWTDRQRELGLAPLKEQ